MNFLMKTYQRTPQSLFSNGNALRNNSFKSAISLEKLYPESNLKITTPKPEANCEYYIPLDELEITHSRSSGPGGQNVNKVNTKVDVRFQVSSATWIKDDVKQKVVEKFKDKITKDGYLVFRSDLTRSQQLNLADCLEKIRSCIRRSVATNPEPSEESQEKIRRRFEKAARDRLIEKRRKSSIKRDRQPHNIVM